MIQYRVDQTNEQVRTESEIHSSVGRRFRILGIGMLHHDKRHDALHPHIRLALPLTFAREALDARPRWEITWGRACTTQSSVCQVLVLTDVRSRT